MAKRDKDTITLGSGKVYLKTYAAEVPATKADLTALCADANLLGHIKGGAALEYTQETYEEKDDLHRGRGPYEARPYHLERRHAQELD